MNRNPGGIQDTHDVRDFQFSDIARSSTPFDWSVGFDIESTVGIIPTKDQGASSSCGGQAWSYYDAVLEALATKSYETRSAKFIYSQTAVPGGGSAGRPNCNVCIDQGVPRESLCLSYENGNPPSEEFMTRGDITDEARQDAKKSRTKSYSNVASDIDLFAQAIRDNGGLVLGLYGENNGTWESAFPKPPVGANKWGHWLYAGKAKVINGRKFIGIKNSWNDSVGDKGWQWIGEEYFTTNNVWYAWTMEFREEGQYIFNRDMKFGDRSEDVRQLQTRIGLPLELQTGYYGPKTKDAVLQYQLQNMTLSWYERYWLAGSICGQRTRSSLNK